MLAHIYISSRQQSMDYEPENKLNVAEVAM